MMVIEIRSKIFIWKSQLINKFLKRIQALQLCLQVFWGSGSIGLVSNRIRPYSFTKGNLLKNLCSCFSVHMYWKLFDVLSTYLYCSDLEARSTESVQLFSPETQTNTYLYALTEDTIRIPNGWKGWRRGWESRPLSQKVKKKSQTFRSMAEVVPAWNKNEEGAGRRWRFILFERKWHQ